jgi:flotillin
MTIEKLNFSLPAVFTIGPDDDPDSLIKYAVLLTGDPQGKPVAPAKSGAIVVAEGRNHVQSIVKGIIEGETRSIVSTMTMEELFKERRVFRDKVIANVQSELLSFGLKIYNANVKELQDTPGSEYFAFLSRKAHEGASNQARVDVAHARMKGEVGEAELQGKAKQDIAKINAATAVLETERKAEKAQADAELTEKEIQIEKNLNLARILAKRAAEEQDTVLQKTVEMRRVEMEVERQRATTVTKAIIQRESDQQKADALLYTQERNADALRAQKLAETDAAFYNQTKNAEAKFFVTKQDAAGFMERQTKEAEASKIGIEYDADAELYQVQQRAVAALDKTKRLAEGQKLEADAHFYTAKLEADAHFYKQQQHAAGMVEMAKGYGAMADVLGGPQGLLQWMMLENGTYEKMAAENAKAVHGMQPKINVWNTGSGAESADSMAPIRNLFQTLPPLLGTIQEQTGLLPPSWLAQMPPQEQHSSSVVSKKNAVNGTSGSK